MGYARGKKTVNITTSGGDYSEGTAAEWEMCDKYLKAIVVLFGVTDYTTISATNLDVIGVNMEAIVNEAIRKAERLTKYF